MKILPSVIATVLAFSPFQTPASEPSPAATGPAGISPAELFAPDNLHAWCAVPFDAKKRGPEERAQMLRQLGFKRFVYDWRAKDIPTFGAEIEALKKQGIELIGW
ncbi:MAG: pyrrolo-quinoline quinone, partial [Verrucomicrobiota bacterium]